MVRLCDLPGYGFAKAHREIRDTFGPMIENWRKYGSIAPRAKHLAIAAPGHYQAQRQGPQGAQFQAMHRLLALLDTAA